MRDSLPDIASEHCNRSLCATPSALHNARVMARALSVLLVEHDSVDAERMLDALREGGFEPRSRRVESESELRDALAAALAGATYVTPLIPRAEVDAFLRRSKVREGKRLTPRQREVLQLLAEGKSMKQVAYDLGLSARTVAHHKYKIMTEQGIDSNAGLIQLAIEQRLIAGSGGT